MRQLWFFGNQVANGIVCKAAEKVSGMIRRKKMKRYLRDGPAICRRREIVQTGGRRSGWRMPP
ncbi:hypothetical protein RGR602_PC02318 (plasmid) [Rhizobium gallicum bv. gallicum R602sp]|uniref:Uncharacterized protein n=1 Tax=Rhizobium gallicum bv. gallicum R602sp TaxID=1041138 RepID=A0A0B4XIV7_9HYPH|nr:hypothetical protein RGR602_PC02318 [Rhizobium gallicum bv. gallicum R602sp]